MERRRSGPAPDERSHLSRPQVFVQLQFGVSWSPRHIPSSHSMTYMSRNLRNSRDSGNFPRQMPPETANSLVAPEPRQHRHQEQSGRHHHHHHHHQKPQFPRGHSHEPYLQPSHFRREPEPLERTPFHNQSSDQSCLQPTGRSTREARSETRGLPHGRGRSAPPPLNDSLWDADAGPSSTLFPAPAGTAGHQQQLWKALPAPPNQYRLGSDGMPWDTFDWPAGPGEVDGEDHGDDLPFANRPTTVPLSPERRRPEDPDRTRELESLSEAMMTVDNGFENQWWYQGGREPTDWFSHGEPGSRKSMPERVPEPMVVSAAEPTFSSADWAEDKSSDLRFLVSPISEASTSPAQGFRPMQRSFSTRAEELFFGT